MRQYKMLVLTDHSNHSNENSLYPLVQAMRQHEYCRQLDVATRGDKRNDAFFKDLASASLLVTKVADDFAFSPTGESFKSNLRKASITDYEVVWLRMPPPLSEAFLKKLTTAFPEQLFINNPAGIYKTGSKEFLVNFPNLCPPMQICRSIEDIIQFKQAFPIVLKPFREYGGKGIVRIDGDQVWEGKAQKTFAEFRQELIGKSVAYLGVQFLKNVGLGDKRIIVVNGKIMGASLRLPAKGSWLCNVAMGGSSHLTSVDPEEVTIIENLDSILSEMGIVMYGVDTLVGNNGKRILSEINTTSIGGLPQIAKLLGKPLVEEATNSIWNYIDAQVIRSRPISWAD